MPIEPDTKDWTWVLHERCPECGFDPLDAPRDDLGRRIRHAAAAMHQRLHGDAVTERPDDATWSPLEYAAHVRDVCDVMRTRLHQMLGEDDPVFANWDQDQAAIDGDYASLDPEHVAAEVDLAAAQLANAADAVPADAWGRPGRRSNGSVFTVETLLVYALHDLEHHVVDVTKAR
ncbi:DinB family protein [Agrococcus carbonis]|uniref:DinB superfamily protein n=1 Tax=Agrococcus carbonis TaxID=684552 RepID=A0A1H1NTU3_9MICO|nr:DinB family protein [Agrococcus carbonis]SDS02397.1 DinB superfamily protein [Agrococcus carbonis]